LEEVAWAALQQVEHAAAVVVVAHSPGCAGAFPLEALPRELFEPLEDAA
jgi:hypothetical protein